MNLKNIPAITLALYSISTHAMNLTAEGNAGQYSSIIHYNTDAFRNVQSGMFCRVNSGSSEEVSIEANYAGQGGSVDVAKCDGSTTWSPVIIGSAWGITPVPSVPFTLKNGQTNSVSVNISYGIHGSSNAWTSLGPYIVPAKATCSVNYSPSVMFTNNVNTSPEPIKILSSGKGNGVIQITSLTTDGSNGPAMQSGNIKLPIWVKVNGIDHPWDSAKGMWEGTNQNDYILHVDKPTTGGMYSGLLKVTLSCV